MPTQGGANDSSGRQDPPEALEQGAAEMEQALRRHLAQTQTREDAEHSPDRAADLDLTELRYCSSLLKKLLVFIARSEDESVSRVISLIRSGASYNEILSTVDQELPRVQGNSEDGRGESASGASQ